MGRLGLGLGLGLVLVLRQGLGLALGLQLRIGIGFRRNHSCDSGLHTYTAVARLTLALAKLSCLHFFPLSSDLCPQTFLVGLHYLLLLSISGLYLAHKM